jgi:hypothetical protein
VTVESWSEPTRTYPPVADDGPGLPSVGVVAHALWGGVLGTMHALIDDHPAGSSRPSGSTPASPD